MGRNAEGLKRRRQKSRGSRGEEARAEEEEEEEAGAQREALAPSFPSDMAERTARHRQLQGNTRAIRAG